MVVLGNLLDWVPCCITFQHTFFCFFWAPTLNITNTTSKNQWRLELKRVIPLPKSDYYAYSFSSRSIMEEAVKYLQELYCYLLALETAKVVSRFWSTILLVHMALNSPGSHSEWCSDLSEKIGLSLTHRVICTLTVLDSTTPSMAPYSLIVRDLQQQSFHSTIRIHHPLQWYRTRGQPY